MGRYKVNNDGTLGAMISGRGKAEYGASTVRTGTITVEGDGSSSFITVNVTFSTPMPDANYMVDINPYTASWERTQWRTLDQTANGFRFDVTRVDGAAMLNAKYLYTAYKLYTDTEYNNILAAMPSDVSASNKLVTENIDNGENIDISSYLNTGFSVAEYIRVRRLTTHSYVMDIGGLKCPVGNSQSLFKNTFPYTITNRFVANLRDTGTSASAKILAMYNTVGTNNVFIHNPYTATDAFYGQVVFFT